VADRREAYRTALEAKQPTARLARVYHRSDARYRLARGRYRAAQRAAAAVRPAAERAESHVARENERRSRHAARVQFVSRLLLVLLALAGSYLLLGLLRRRHSRYFPVALAAVGASAVLALVMAGDYTSDYVEVGQTGPLLISIGGIVMTLLAFWALQRYLRRRIPARRVRRRECPFCGYPAGQNRHCEGCGRTLVGECTACQGPRRVGTAHCATCGAT
jgi:hypothetical protein